MKTLVKQFQQYLLKKGLTLDITGKEYMNINNISVDDLVNWSKKVDIQINESYIYLGAYPQTLKDRSIKIVDTSPDSNGYYKGSDGEVYAKVVAKANKNTYLFNDGITSIVNGISYYFKVEPIKWKIEEESNGPIKLISEYILDSYTYYSLTSDRKIDDKTVYANNYEYSDIRKWLNSDFINKAFSIEIQDTYINTIAVFNGENSVFKSEDTYDKIFLPSLQEMTSKKYGYSTNYEETSSVRSKLLTDYAKALGCYMYTDKKSDNYNKGKYWTRTPIYYHSNYSGYQNTKCGTYFVHICSSGGSFKYSVTYYENNDTWIFKGFEVNQKNIGVVPSMYISI